MTGHGRGVAERDGSRITVEVRAVNHRFLEVKLRPVLGAGVEDRVVREVRRRLERGAVTVVVSGPRAGSARVRVDLELARRSAAALEEVRGALGLSEPISLTLVAGQPGVLQVGEEGVDEDSEFAVLAPALAAALDELVAMRRREGDTLAVDLLARLRHLGALAEEVAALAAAAPGEGRRRLSERLSRLLAGTGATLDPGRLEAEVALLADRLDITEELVRLRSHLEQGRALVAGEAAAGRRLDFLAQEIGREVNTIGSKSQSAEVARLVVECKAELEKVREQIQNVE